MKTFVTLMVICGLLLSVTAAMAANVSLHLATMGAQGWTTTIHKDSANVGSIEERLNKYIPGMSWYILNGDKDKTSNCWSALSTTNYDGLYLSSITKLTMTNLDANGIATVQQPSFLFACKKGGALNFRDLLWLPFSDGTTRTLQVATTHDALVAGSWFCAWTGATYNSMAAVLAAMPDIQIATGAEITAMSSGYSAYGAKGFNVGCGNPNGFYNVAEDENRGSIRDFTIGINGVDTTFTVPEPGSILALVTGLIGFVGLRKRF